MKEKRNFLTHVFSFYYQGFKEMPVWGRQLWIIIILKLFIMFAIFRFFFFPDFLQTNFNSDAERSQHVIEQLTEPNHLK